MKTGSSALKYRARLGARGEKLAAKLLESEGCKILCRNWKSGSGELDVVALDGTVVVFVEVKTRRAGSAYAPLSGLSPTQRKRIAKGAEKYLDATRHQLYLHYRFDTIEVVLSRFSVKCIRHHRHARRG